MLGAQAVVQIPRPLAYLIEQARGAQWWLRPVPARRLINTIRLGRTQSTLLHCKRFPHA